MSRRPIGSGSPFEAPHGYTRALVDGGFVFAAGTTGYDYATKTKPEEVAAHAEACWRTIASGLAEAGSGLGCIVRATCLVTDRAVAEAVLRVCGCVLADVRLADVRPAAMLHVAAGLPRAEMKVEIGVTATVG